MKLSYKMSAEEETEESEEDVLSLISLAGSENWSPQTLTYFGPEKRSICIFGDIEEAMALAIVSQLMELGESDEIIHVYINTYGGDLNQALAIYDTMRMIQAPIVTIACGACMSAGLLIYQGGDLRCATPNTRFMYHEPIYGLQAISAEGADAFVQNYTWAKTTYENILKERSKMKKKTWKDKFSGATNFFFTAHEAKEYRLVDEIIYPVTKKIKVIKNG